jgi:hypothetical protein
MASTNLIADIGTVITNGPNAATLQLASLAAGPIGDYPGNNKSLRLHFQEAANLLGNIQGATDTGDPMFINLQMVRNTINGAGGGTATPIALMTTIITTGPTALTSAKAIDPSGPIMDWQGNCKGVLLILKEAAVLSANQVAVTDATDAANLALLQSIKATLV